MRYFLLIAAVVLSGCASFRFSEQQWQASVEQKVSEWNLEDVRRINTFRLDSWTPLGEKYLILRASFARPYLIELSSRCPDLDWSHAIGTKQTMSSSLDAGFDSIVSGEQPNIPCRIGKIYPLTREQDKALTKLEENAAEETQAAKQA
ncbi:DUF6491 family protein [Bowmanella sp. JS7-9]|uniref:DUF6491 family protein n=1 Tax=Pseudobowmanella zhangzhouensis TaxID=1537679 RepID=A0ABW1XIH1_9ALTE|nr:DUF6491 family protein [Bowmanella sp. JS7-9]TBX21394.1 hypothetical protein TK45_12665 [Bowmanella sp. JS7-9]